MDGKAPRSLGPQLLTRREDDSLLPNEIGGFAIHRLLGEGAFGLVYLGFDSKLDRWVAVKVPHAHTLNSPRARQRFEREAKAAAQLRHPHIVPVFAAGFDGKHHFLASQFIAGPGAGTGEEPPLGLTLDDAVKKNRLDDHQAARIVHDLAEALHYAHTVGIVHRDVKPANVMVDEQMGVHLGDFGLAHLQDSVEKITQDGTIMGTPAYMAPELAKGSHGDVRPAGDQYSLGVLMYELLCGKVPFSGPVGAVLALHVSQEPSSPSAVRADIPKDLETICLKALAKRPEDRYADCQALADDLRRWLEGEPIQARRLTSAERLSRWTRKNPLTAALAGGIFIVLVLGILITTVLAALASQRATDLAKAIEQAERNAEDARKHADQSQKNLAKAEGNLTLATKNEAEANRNLDLAKKNEAEAKANLDLARKNEGEAKANLDLAKKNEVEAKQNAEKALAAAQKYESVLLPKYEADLSAAQSYWEQKQSQKAMDLLEGLRPENLGGKDFRGFEWHYLSKAYRLPVETFKIKGVDGYGFTGKYLAIAHRNAIQLWDTQSRQLLHAFKTEGRSYGIPSYQIPPSLIVSSDGTLVGAGSRYSDQIDVWETETGQLLRTFKTKGVLLAFSHDNNFVTGKFAGNHQTLDVREGKFNKTLPVGGLAWSPDGKTVITRGPDGVIDVLEAGTGKLVRSLQPPNADAKTRGWVSRFTFSADGKRVAANYLFDQKERNDPKNSERSHAIQVWDLKSGQRLCLIPLGKYTAPYVHHLALSFNGEDLIAGFENEARVWSVQTQKLLRTIDIGVRLDTAGVIAIPDGKRLLSVHYSRSGSGLVTVRDWDLQPDQLVYQFKDAKTCVSAPVFSQDGKSLACGVENGAVIWNVDTGKPLRRFEAKVGGYTLAYSPDGKYLATGASEAVKVWDTQNGQLLHSLPAMPALKSAPTLGGHRIESLAFSHDSKRLACGCWDGSFKIWEIPSGNELQGRAGEKKPGPYSSRTGVSFMADGTSFASWFTDKSSALNVCDLQTGQMLLTNVSHHDRSNAKFGSDGRRLASFPYQEHKGTVKVWDVKTGQLLQDFDGPPSPIVNVAFNHDGTRLAIGGSKWIYISNTQTGQLLLSLEENKRDRLYAGGIAFSPDGKKLASTLSGTLKVWDASR